MRDWLQNKSRAGFTLVEVLVVAPIVILVIGTFVGVVISLTGKGLEARGANTVIYQTNAAIDQIKQDVKLSQAFLAKNSISLMSPQGQNDVTQNFTVGQNGPMILMLPATTEDSGGFNYSLVRLKNKPAACNSTAVSQNETLTTNIIYFVKEKDGVTSLWRRTVLPSNYKTAGCEVPIQRPSCDPDKVSAAFCQARDVRLLDDIHELTVEYYPSPTATTKLTSITDQTVLDSATTVKIKLDIRKDVSGRTVNYATSFQATSIN